MNVSLTLSDFSVPWPWRATVISLSAHPLLWKCESVWDDKRFSCRNKFEIIFELLVYSLLVYSVQRASLLLILKKPALVFPPLAHFRHKVKLTFDLSNLASMSKKCRGMGARVSKTTVIFKCPWCTLHHYEHSTGTDVTLSPPGNILVKYVQYRCTAVQYRAQYRDRCDTLPLVTFLSRGQLRVRGANDG